MSVYCKLIKYTFATIVVSVGLISNTNAQIQYHTSSLGRYQIYASTWYNSAGAQVGLQVHYNLPSVNDVPNKVPAYAAVCINSGNTYSPCIEHSARAWTKTTSYYYVGYWVTQNIPMNCNDPITVYKLQVHQPYLANYSTLNFQVYGTSPYNSSNQLFYSGSSDSADLQVQGCRQLYW